MLAAAPACACVPELLRRYRQRGHVGGARAVAQQLGSRPAAPLQSGSRPSLRALRAAPRGALAVARRRHVLVAAARVEDALSAADPSRWITGFTPNNALLRLAVTVAAVAAAAQGARFLPLQAAAFAHLAAYSVWFGANFYTTFVVGIALFKRANLPRQTFRDVQEVLFPRYFQLGAAAVAFLLAAAPAAFPGAAYAASGQAAVLGAALAATLLNLLWLEPVTSGVMKRRATIEKMSPLEASTAHAEGKEAALKALGAKFGMYHGLSSLANLVVFGCAVAHGWWAVGRALV